MCSFISSGFFISFPCSSFVYFSKFSLPLRILLRIFQKFPDLVPPSSTSLFIFSWVCVLISFWICSLRVFCALVSFSFFFDFVSASVCLSLTAVWYSFFASLLAFLSRFVSSDSFLLPFPLIVIFPIFSVRFLVIVCSSLS